jgi:hypothetical protein
MYSLDGRKTPLISMSDDISILAYYKGRGTCYDLAGPILFLYVYNFLYRHTELGRGRYK